MDESASAVAELAGQAGNLGLIVEDIRRAADGPEDRAEPLSLLRAA